MEIEFIFKSFVVWNKIKAKMNKIKLTGTAILLSVLLFSSNINAQFKYPTKSQVSAVKGKILLVSYILEDRNTVDKLRETPEKLAQYRNSINYLDTLLRRSVGKVWKFGKGVEFMAALDAAKLMAEGNSKYAYMGLGITERKTHEWYYIQGYDSNMYHKSIRDIGKDNGYAVLSVSLPGSNKKPEPVYSIDMDVTYPAQGDITSALQLMENEFLLVMKKPETKFDDFESEVKDNRKLLKDKTLLIDQNQLERGVTEAEISKYYPYTFKITDFDTINDIETNCTAGYAYILTMPYKISTMNMGSGSTAPIATYFQIIVSANDGKVLGRAVPPKTETPDKAEHIGKKQVKDYTEE